MKLSETQILQEQKMDAASRVKHAFEGLDDEIRDGKVDAAMIGVLIGRWIGHIHSRIYSTEGKLFILNIKRAAQI